MTTSSQRWLIGLLSLVSVLALSLPTRAHLEHGQSGIATDAPLETVQPTNSAPSGTAPSKTVALQLDVQPPLSQVIPAHQPVRLKLHAVDSQRISLQPTVPSAPSAPPSQWQITLNTPAKTPWLSTDFPIVEGTTLLNANLTPVSDESSSELELETVLPIRGAYTLQATMTAPSIKAPVTQTFVLNVPENPVKYRNAITLAVILLLVGTVGGWLIGKQPQERSEERLEELSPSVRLLLSGAALVAIVALLAVNFSAERVGHSHADHASPSPSLSRATAQAGSLRLEYLGDTIATVGKLATLSARVIDTRTNQPTQNATFRLQAQNPEHGTTVLSVKGRPDANGVFTWQQQFFDGSLHNLKIEAISPPNPSVLTLNQAIEVEGVAPPLSVRLITLSYMTAIVATGMAIGFGAGKIRRNPRRFKVSQNSPLRE